MALQARTVDELAAMLEANKDEIDVLVESASEKFNQSEVAEWNEGLYQEGTEIVKEVQRLLEEGVRVREEFERRFGQVVPADRRQMPADGSGDHEQRWYRRDLTTRTVPKTSDIDVELPYALQNLLSLVPRSWWQHQRSLMNEDQRNAVLRPLLLCGRERWGMHFTTIHKYAYYLNVAEEHLKGEPRLDIYTAARAVPQICSLGMSIDSLKDVKGADLKLRQLHKAPSGETDARIFELLVAAAFARIGHDVAFIETTAEKTADLRLGGLPFPTVIECKRKQTLNAYEIKEFAIIRSVFAILCSEREQLGLVGELAIDFKQEIVHLPVGDIVQNIRDMTRSLSPNANKEADWGTISLRAVAVSQDLEPTRLYSPAFLGKVFGIDLELDEFDGICAIVENDQSPVADRAELPFLMKWTSNSEAAMERKLQTIKTLWVEAVSQIPTGEAGLVYLAYEEGHRPSLADARTDALRKLISDFYFKRRAIAMPMTLISRLFPNTVAEGRPDLIENTIPLAEGDEENYDFWTHEMPTRVFVP